MKSTSHKGIPWGLLVSQNKINAEFMSFTSNFIVQKKERTSVLRSLPSKLAKAKTIDNLRSELLGLMELEDFEIFEKTRMNWSDEDKVVVYAQKIVEIDSEVARRLLS